VTYLVEATFYLIGSTLAAYLLVRVVGISRGNRR
jgi:hypothetical protein